jgi:hypothetical protein
MSTATGGSSTQDRNNRRMKLTTMAHKYQGENRAVCGKESCNNECSLI